MAKLLFLPVFLLVVILNSAFAYEESFQTLSTRDEAEQPFWLIEHEKPVANVILFAGGKGKLKISEDGIRKKGNFLVRSRELFADAGFTVAVVDKPTDQDNLLYFRTSKEHAKDIQSVIKFLYKRNKRPVWLIGTSRGTFSAAAVASQISDPALKGIVLTASVLSESNDGKESLQTVSVESIKVATLFVHHEEDGCYVCEYDELPDMMKKFTHTKKRELKSFTGGEDRQSNGCKSKTYHGFLGIEDNVVKEISDWIKDNNK